MTVTRHAFRTALALVALAAGLPAEAAGFDSSIKNNSLALSPDGRTAVASNSEEARIVIYDVPGACA